MKQVCPDSQIISIYLDGELPSPWKEKMEAHLEQCSSCGGKLKDLKQLQERLFTGGPLANELLEKPAPAVHDSSNSEPVIEAAKNRVWQNLQAGQCLRSSAVIQSKTLDRNLSRSAGLWRRRLSIPFPAAAAAAVILILLTMLWVRGGSNNSNGFASQPQEQAVRENFILAAVEDMPDIIPAMDMNGVLQYLGADGSDIIILRLPESKNFFRSGEPAIIRAADYTRR